MHLYLVFVPSVRTGDDNGDKVQGGKAGGPFGIWDPFVVRLLVVVLVQQSFFLVYPHPEDSPPRSPKLFFFHKTNTYRMLKKNSQNLFENFIIIF